MDMGQAPRIDRYLATAMTDQRRRRAQAKSAGEGPIIAAMPSPTRKKLIIPRATSMERISFFEEMARV